MNILSIKYIICNIVFNKLMYLSCQCSINISIMRKLSDCLAFACISIILILVNSAESCDKKEAKVGQSYYS